MHRVDVIIVLGAAVWPDRTLSPSLDRRVTASISLYKKKVADYLLFSGGPGIHPPAECILMKERAVASGVVSDDILLDQNSSNTFESVINCKEIMRIRKFKNAVVVTDSYHVLRCVISFRLLGIQCTAYGTKNKKRRTPRLKWIYYHVREVVAIPWYIILCLFYRLFPSTDGTNYSN